MVQKNKNRGQEGRREEEGGGKRGGGGRVRVRARVSGRGAGVDMGRGMESTWGGRWSSCFSPCGVDILCTEGKRRDEQAKADRRRGVGPGRPGSFLHIFFCKEGKRGGERKRIGFWGFRHGFNFNGLSKLNAQGYDKRILELLKSDQDLKLT